MRAGVLVLMMLLMGPARGRDAGLEAQISPGPLARPHAELEGALRCTSCHGGGKDAMPAQCQQCHRDIAWLTTQGRGYHASAEVRARSCASCHPDHAGRAFALIKWPDGGERSFDHRRTGWPLEQSHRKPACNDCHRAERRVSAAAPLARGGHWTGLEQSCTSCHRDPHRGVLGNDCARCHDAGAWRQTPGFSHDSTDYPLTGLHARVTCDRCHQPGRATGRPAATGAAAPVFRPLPHQTCTDCHRDPHGGRLGAGCDDCHTTSGFSRVEPSRFDHQRTRFKLEGAHAGIRCAACHADFSTEARKRPAFATCQTCHADPHGGSATLAGKPADCAQCHDTRSFARGAFTLAQHRGTRYPLAGRHQQVACGGCHRRETNAARAAPWGKSRVVLRPAFAKCTDCHADDHAGQLAGQPALADCSACHTVAGWSPSGFDRDDHARLALGLEGRHAEIACGACHGKDRKGLRPLNPAGLGRAGVRLRLTETGCRDCHTDPHRGRYATATTTRPARDCTACHGSEGFRPAVVPLDAHADYGFPLEGAHRATPCTACHAELKAPPSRRSTLVLVPARSPALTFAAPTGCGNCHRSPHGNQFDSRKDQGRCDACHGTDAFAPASRLNHDRDTRFPLKGAHERVPCTSCHRSTPGSSALQYRPLSGRCEDCHTGKESR